MARSKPGYSLVYLEVMATELALAALLYFVTRHQGLELPLAYDTLWHIIRSVISLFFFGFFLALMGRHTTFIIFAFADQIDRSRMFGRHVEEKQDGLIL